MIRITTHVLDTSAGKPASGLAVRLERADGAPGAPLASAMTGSDGRVAEWLPSGVPAGRYRLVFATGAWYQAAGQKTLYPEVAVEFEAADGVTHYHLPLLISPFGYSTYRGS
ncbi:MAG TPA: hydroxyisourate hydrolase [Gemmatimonadales bacterium]|jgi:5-hydroxyisourate hydrolase